DRLGGATLLADHPAEVFACDAELDDGSGVALGLLHLDGIRLRHEMLGQEQDQILHGTVLRLRPQALADAPARRRLWATVCVGRAPLASHAASLSFFSSTRAGS